MKGRRLGLLLILLALQSLAEGCVFQVRIDDSIIFEKDLTVALGNAYSSHPFIVSALIMHYAALPYGYGVGEFSSILKSTLKLDM